MRYLIVLSVLALALNAVFLIAVFSGASFFGLIGSDLMQTVFNLLLGSTMVWFADLIGLLFFVGHKQWKSVKVLAGFFIALTMILIFMVFLIMGQ